MIRTLLTTTALAALLATGALAQDATTTTTTETPAATTTETPAATDTTAPADSMSTETPAATDTTTTPAATDTTAAPAATDTTAATSTTTNSVLATGYTVADSDNLASNIIGSPVYSNNTNDAENFGDINDLIIDENGDVAAVIIGVGGFLGIGEKNVAVTYDELDWVVAEDNTERYTLNTTREALDAAPAFQEQDDDADNAQGEANNAMAPADGAMAPADNAMAPAADTNAMAPATDTAMAPAADGTATTPMAPLNREGMTDFDEATLTADDLEGTQVYGVNDEHIGGIGDVLLSEDGKTVDAIIIDFGGFLGIGTKPVAVAFEGLNFLADPNNNRALTLNLTREQMEAAPAFNADTYAAERNTQRLVVSGN